MLEDFNCEKCGKKVIKQNRLNYSCINCGYSGGFETLPMGSQVIDYDEKFESESLEIYVIIKSFDKGKIKSIREISDVAKHKSISSIKNEIDKKGRFFIGKYSRVYSHYIVEKLLELNLDYEVIKVV